MKIIYWFLMALPGIAFFLDDFGTATVPLRIFDICLILIVIYDILKTRISRSIFVRPYIFLCF